MTILPSLAELGHPKRSSGLRPVRIPRQLLENCLLSQHVLPDCLTQGLLQHRTGVLLDDAEVGDLLDEQQLVELGHLLLGRQLLLDRYGGTPRLLGLLLLDLPHDLGYQLRLIPPEQRVHVEAEAGPPSLGEPVHVELPHVGGNVLVLEVRRQQGREPLLVDDGEPGPLLVPLHCLLVARRLCGSPSTISMSQVLSRKGAPFLECAIVQIYCMTNCAWLQYNQCMRPSRHRSQPARRRIYSKIKTTHPQQSPAQSLLRRELDLLTFAAELSKPDYDIAISSQFSYVRQNLLVKKEIVRCLERRRVDLALNRLKHLLEGMPKQDSHSPQRRNTLVAMFFLEAWGKVNGVDSGEEQHWQLLDTMREHLEYFMEEGEVVRLRLLSVLALLLLALKGILMSKQEKNLVSLVLQRKRERMGQLEGDDKMFEFEAVLYLLLQLYKIIYLTNSSHPSLPGYHQQLTVYDELYRSQDQPLLCSHEIGRVVRTMEPPPQTLEPYLDSAFIKQIGNRNIRQQVVGQGLPVPKRRSSVTLLATDSSHTIQSQTSNPTLKISLPKLEPNTPKRNTMQPLVLKRPSLRTSIAPRKKLSLIQPEQSSKSRSQRQDVLQVHQLEEEGLIIQFIVWQQKRLGQCQLALELRNGGSLLDLRITLSMAGLSPEIFMLKGISVTIRRKSLREIARFMQQVFENLFFTGHETFTSLHNLAFSEHFVPEQIDQNEIVPALIRIISFIRGYLHWNQEQSVVGGRHVYPIISLTELNKKITAHQEETQRRQGTFNKRTGMLLLPNLKISEPKVALRHCRFLIRKGAKRSYEYFLVSLNYHQHLQGADIHCFDEEHQPPALYRHLKIIRRIYKTDQLGNKCHFDRAKLISRCLSLVEDLEKVHVLPSVFKVEEDLELTGSSRLIADSSIKMHMVSTTKPNKKSKTVKVKCRGVQVLQAGGKYWMLERQCLDECIVLKGIRDKLVLPYNWKQRGWQIVRKRLRMYSAMRIQDRDGSWIHIDFSFDKGLIIQSTQLRVSLMRHWVVWSQPEGYCVVNEYFTSCYQYLYEVHVHQTRYLALNPDRLSISKHSWNFKKKKLGHLTLSQYNGHKQTVSQANKYYCSLQLN